MQNNPTTLFEKVNHLKQSGLFSAISELIPYSGFVNLELVEQEGGLVTVLRQTPSNIGNTKIPAVHGGVIGGLLEHAAVMEIIYSCELTHFPKIINISVDYLRPAMGQKDTFARTKLIKQGKSVSNVRVEAWQDDPERPVAAAHAHFLMR